MRTFGAVALHLVLATFSSCASLDEQNQEPPTSTNRAMVGRWNRSEAFPQLPRRVDENASHSDQDRPRRMPHILLLMTDQQRYDALSPQLTPHVWRHVVQPGVRFTSAFSSTPTCLPARFALLTGRSPWQHGMLGYGLDMPNPLPTGFASMPTALRACGYFAAMVGKGHFPKDSTNRKSSGQLYGFDFADVYDGLGEDAHACTTKKEQQKEPGTVTSTGESYEDWFAKTAAAAADTNSSDTTAGDDCTGFKRDGLSFNSRKAAPWPMEERLHPTAWTAARASALLAALEPRTMAQSLFLKVSFHRPHPPFDPPQRLWLKEYTKTSGSADASEEQSLPATQYSRGGLHAWDRHWWPTNKAAPTKEDAGCCGSVPKDEQRRARAGYAASVRFVDEAAAVVLDAWAEHAEEQATTTNGYSSLVIFLSDHGEMLGDHYLWRKGYPWDGSARIPLAMRWPAAYENEASLKLRGGIVSAPVELRDVLPTMVDAARLAMVQSEPAEMNSSSAPIEKTKTWPPQQLTKMMVGGWSLMELLRDEKLRNGNEQPQEEAVLRRHSTPALRPLSRPSGAKQWRSWIDLEHAKTYRAPNQWSSLTDGTRWKYLYFAPDRHEQLFDLKLDPFESCDLVHLTRQDCGLTSTSSEPVEREQAIVVLKRWRSRLVAQYEKEERGERWIDPKTGALKQRFKKDLEGANFPERCKYRIGGKFPRILVTLVCCRARMIHDTPPCCEIKYDAYIGRLVWRTCKANRGKPPPGHIGPVEPLGD